MYDIAIIGGGPAGLACVKSSLSNNLRTILIEEGESSLGGACLNRGCIPTKFFLKNSTTNKNWSALLKEKEILVSQIKEPLLLHLKNQGLVFAWGKAEFIDKNTLKVDDKVVKAKNIVISTGSLPRKIIEDKKIVLGEDLLSFPELPDKILVIGAGYIGLEFASLLNNLGKSVTVIEKEPVILPGFDGYFSKRLRTILSRKGIKIDTKNTVSAGDLEEFNLAISAVGRMPNLKMLKLENIGLELNEQGWIKTDEYMRTSIDNIYACGDITGEKLLAYIAEYQADLCIKNILGQNEKIDYQGIAECVFSIPQAAKVGILEDEAKKKGIKYRVVRSNFLKFSSSYLYDDNDGFVQVLVDEKNRIIGAGMISQRAGELINIFSLCIRNSLTLDKLKKCHFIHPTLSEIIPLFLNLS